MAEKESVRRTGDCRVKLAPSMMERLESLAELYGMPSATFAASLLLTTSTGMKLVSGWLVWL